MIDATYFIDEPIVVMRGDTWQLGDLEFYTDDTKTTPLDISADNFIMDVIEGDNKIRPVISFTNGSGITISGAGNNVLTRSKPATETRIRHGSYSYNLQWTRSGVIRTIRNGVFTILDDK